MASPVNVRTPSTTKTRTGKATVTSTTPASLLSLTTNPANMAAMTALPIDQVIVQSSHTNSASSLALVGNATDGTYYELAPGDQITLPIADVAAILVALSSSSPSTQLNWIAIT